MAMRIDALSAPLFVSWQITRDCDLACLHCCTDSAPGRKLKDELDLSEAVAVVDQIVSADVPYVMLCGGEPLVSPHFFAIVEMLGRAGVELKIETNGQRFDPSIAERLAPLPIRSIQISLDADHEDVYRAQRPGGSLAKVHAACRAVRAAGLPLEVTFAPTRLNIGELPAVLERAKALGAFRFNTGRLMRIGTAARRWGSLPPSEAQYAAFFDALERAAQVEPGMELCYIPVDVAEGLRRALVEPPATLLVLPNGWVKVAAALPHVCADLRRETLAQAWAAYRDAWRDAGVIAAANAAAAHDERHSDANAWRLLPLVNA